MKNTFKAPDGTILVEGRKYRWNGFNEMVLCDFSWYGSKCKIAKIDGDKITIYDYDDKKEIVFTKDGLDKISARFEKNNLMGLIKCLKKY